jgi:hypothetical protein
VFGEEAHIVARSAGGPRAGDLDDDSRHSHTNLLLLCSKHHKQIDDQPNHFTVERLREIKEQHAAWVRRSLDEEVAGGPRLVPDPAFPQPRVLALITRGNALWNMIKTSVTFEYAMPDGLPDDDESLVVEFLDLLRDYLDIAPDLHSVRENRDAEKSLEHCIRDLAAKDFLVGAHVRHMLYVDGRGDPMAWPMLRVEVQPASQAVVAGQDGRPFTSGQGEAQSAEE